MEVSPEEETRAVRGSGEAARGHTGMIGPWQTSGGHWAEEGESSSGALEGTDRTLEGVEQVNGRKG